MSDWAGRRRVFFIFDRGTKKFAGDIGLWLEYIDYAKQQKAVNVLAKVFTRWIVFFG